MVSMMVIFIYVLDDLYLRWWILVVMCVQAIVASHSTCGSPITIDIICSLTSHSY